MATDEKYYTRNEQFEAHGFNCEVITHPTLGHLCGYVDLPEGHPCWGTECTEVDVHGGITYAREHSDGYWRVGFDCAHIGDIVPGSSRKYGGNDPSAFNDTFKDNAYVRRELERLAEQLSETAAIGKQA